VEGKLAVTRLHLEALGPQKKVVVKVGGKPVAATVGPAAKGVSIALPHLMSIKAGQSLSVTLSAS
jgi:hypothetical protein